MQIIIYILGAISGYLLWGKVTWLAITVIVLTLSYSVHPSEQQEFNTNGSYDKTTAIRLGLTFALVVIVFIYALFVKINENNFSKKQKSSSFVNYHNSENFTYTNNNLINLDNVQNIESLQLKVNEIYQKGETIDQAVENGEIKDSDKLIAKEMYQKKLDDACASIKEAVQKYGPSHIPVMEGCDY